jgi:actin-related protein 8
MLSPSTRRTTIRTLKFDPGNTSCSGLKPGLADGETRRDYMKRDDQVLALRLQEDETRDRLVQNAKDRDRALNEQAGDASLLVPDLQTEESAAGASLSDPSNIIVIHPGSQNLRIGFASDALPKTIPTTLATRHPRTESEILDALPRREHITRNPEEQYSEEWRKKYQKACNDLKIDMRANKRKVLPNSKELVQNFNRRTEAEIIPEHNDPVQIDWTDVAAQNGSNASSSTPCYVGHQAERIPDDSEPKFRLWHPIQHGWFNEDDYDTEEHLHDSFETLLEKTIGQELGLTRNSAWRQYSCVFVIPDLYDKKYVEQVLHACMTRFEFSRIAFIQESMAATFGAGYTQACVVDVGAQKTSITCVEDGLCIEDSRINLKYGGFDVTETFTKMMLHDWFPYQEINLRRRYDFLLAEELKIKHCTMSQADISVQLYQFHLRAPNQPTRKYQFKTYDEVILAPMGFYDPSMFDNRDKLKGRRKLIDRSYNAYDVEVPDDPVSMAQTAILALIKPSLTAAPNGLSSTGNEMATPSKEKAQPFFMPRGEMNGTPATSNAPSPAPEGASTPIPPPFVFGARDKDNGSPAPNGRNGGTPGPGAVNGSFINGGTESSNKPPIGMFIDGLPSRNSAKALAAERDGVLPVAPLDIAILTSIQNAAKGDDKRLRDLLGSIMVIGGGSKIPQFAPFLEEKLKQRRPDLVERIMVGKSARDMDEQVVAWKGASVFAKLGTNDSWISPFEYERLGARILHHKVLWPW